MRPWGACAALRSRPELPPAPAVAAPGVTWAGGGARAGAGREARSRDPGAVGAECARFIPAFRLEFEAGCSILLILGNCGKSLNLSEWKYNNYVTGRPVLPIHVAIRPLAF